MAKSNFNFGYKMKGKGNMLRLDRYKGALLGVAVGDALGAPLEFMTAESIKEKYGEPVTEMLGGGWLHAEPGEVTDDTQLTLAIAEGMVNSRADENLYEAIGENFMRWFETHPKDVGDTCARVLSTMKHTFNISIDSWHKTAQRGTRTISAGNGALMRTIYPALWYSDTDVVNDVSVAIGRMTHWHEAVDLTIQAYTTAINKIVNSDMDVEEAKTEMNIAMERVVRYAEQENRVPLKPTGYCIDSLMCAIASINNTDTFEYALVCAVNLGGDADTIGAITGGLAGAIYGINDIPKRWLSTLNNNSNKKVIQLFNPDFCDSYTEDDYFTKRMEELANLAYYHALMQGKQYDKIRNKKW